ncbi:MAG: sulfite exporter TauE/SafE family protein [Thermoplasmata archaeon]
MNLALFLSLILLMTIAAGLLGSLTGLGGGVVAVPVLIVFFQFPFVDAVGVSLITILATSTTSGATYVRDHITDLRIGMFLEIATVPGAFVGAVVAIFLARSNLEDALLVALGAVLILSAVSSLLRGRQTSTHGGRPDRISRYFGFRGTYHDHALGTAVSYEGENTKGALGVMFCAGVVSALFGIGAGVLKVFALEGALNLPMKVATATSNFMIGVTAAAGASVLLMAGYVNPLFAAPAAIGTALGSYVGSRYLPRLRNEAVRWIFVVVVFALAIEVILRGVGFAA